MDTPTFVGQIDNVTAIIGEDIVLKCKVKNLRSRRVTKEDPAFHRGILSVVALFPGCVDPPGCQYDSGHSPSQDYTQCQNRHRPRGGPGVGHQVRFCDLLRGLPYMTSAMGGGRGVPKKQTKGTKLREFCT